MYNMYTTPRITLKVLILISIVEIWKYVNTIQYNNGLPNKTWNHSLLLLVLAIFKC